MKTLKEIEKEIVDYIITREEKGLRMLGYSLDGKIMQIIRQAIAEILEEVVNELQLIDQKAVKAAEFVGKNGTNSGPIAQARIDGFKYAVAEIRKRIKLITE